MVVRTLQQPIETKDVAVRTYAAAKCVQQDGATIDLIRSNVFCLAAVVLLHVAIY